MVASTPFLWFGIFVVAIIVAVCALRLPKRYRIRACMGKEWRRRFPSASKESIRRFLEIFAVEAFAFRPPHKLKFSPDDKVMDVYRAKYPLQGEPDSLELETLYAVLRKEYGYDLGKVWSVDITLGDIFQRIM
jgi:hypothetical protein